MTSGEYLNGKDLWHDYVAEAWSQQWLRAEIFDQSYRWNVLATELHMSSKQMGCETQKFLAGIARTRAAIAEYLKRSIGAINMLRVKVETTNVDERSGEKNGRQWRMRNQEAWIYLVGKDGKEAPFPTAIKVPLEVARNEGEPNQPPFVEGEYNLPASAIYVKKFGDLAISTKALKLVKPKHVQQPEKKAG